MNAEQAGLLVGLPYKEGSFGPDDFNCWGLLNFVQREYFNVTMPIAPLGDAEGCLALAKNCLETEVWARVEIPQHGDGALMRGGNDPHVGVYLEIDGGGILHALEGEGVVFTHLPSLNHCGFGRTTYYRFKHDD